MTFLEFIVSFSLLLLLSSFFVLGWYRLTRHSIIINPDNSENIEGLIFRGWSAYWEKIIGTKNIYYSGGALQNKLNELNYLAPNIYKKINQELTKEEIDKVERLLSVSIEGNGLDIQFYIEENTYRFPEWVRNPISQCPACMSSVYGSILYWAAVFLINGAFDWTSHKKIAILLIYPTYCLILSCINLFFVKKIN